MASRQEATALTHRLHVKATEVGTIRFVWPVQTFICCFLWCFVFLLPFLFHCPLLHQASLHYHFPPPNHILHAYNYPWGSSAKIMSVIMRTSVSSFPRNYHHRLKELEVKLANINADNVR